MPYGTINADVIGNSNGMTGNAIGPGFKNRIINGAMVIDQRNAGASVNTNGAFPVDRWKQEMSGGGVITSQRSTTAPANFVNSIYFLASTADSSIAASDSYFFTQNIEGFNVADLGWGTATARAVTISFQVRSSITGTYCVALGNSAFNRLYVATYAINAANTWETKTITIPGDTSGTWLTDNGIGLRMYFDLGSGSNYNASSSGSWLGTGVGIRTSGSVNWIATLNATFYITGVQLEVGETATSFDYRPYGTEFALCQRYYQNGSVLTNNVIQTYGYPSWTFLVQMRATPTMTSSGNGTPQLLAFSGAGFYQNTNGTSVGGTTSWTASIEL